MTESDFQIIIYRFEDLLRMLIVQHYLLPVQKRSQPMKSTLTSPHTRDHVAQNSPVILCVVIGMNGDEQRSSRVIARWDNSM